MMIKSLVVAAAFIAVGTAQTYQRLGTCPTLGCILPPDQQDFLAGQYFDLRLEIHAPVNGSEANGGVPDENFTVTIAKGDGETKSIEEFFGLETPELETWDFSWYEDLFAEDADKKTVVNVASKVYRRVALYEPGEYTVTLKYYDGETTTAQWTVRDIHTKRKAKNVVMFIGESYLAVYQGQFSTTLLGIYSIDYSHGHPYRRWYDHIYDYGSSSFGPQDGQWTVQVSYGYVCFSVDISL